MHHKDAHCSYCGRRYEADQVWPRLCPVCNNITYRNPLPVAVTLVPVEDGLLVIRRGIEPQRGWLALPGGYVDFGETWQEAAAREVFEETGLRLSPDEVRDFAVRSAAERGVLLVFGLATRRTLAELPPFVPNDETLDRTVISNPQEMAFPLHTWAVREFFARSRS